VKITYGYGGLRVQAQVRLRQTRLCAPNQHLLLDVSPEVVLTRTDFLHRDALPSIKHLELDKLKTDHSEHQRYPMMATSATLGSPTTSTIYSGPPPPYSSAVSSAGLALGVSGYISPPHSSRRSRDEKDSPSLPAKSLPSIHEALGDNRAMPPFPSPAAVVPPPQQSHHGLAAPSAPLGQPFPDAPRGPSNPFSQSIPPPPAAREAVFASQSPSVVAHYEPQAPRTSFPMINTSEPLSQSAHHHAFPQSPRHGPGQSSSHYTNGYDTAPTQSPHTYPTPRSSFPFSSGSYPPPPRSYQQPEAVAKFEHTPRLDEHRSSFSKDAPYSESVKRELEVYDAETALKEIIDSSARTLDFSRVWSQRSYQGPRNGIYNEALPGLIEVEEMMVHSERVLQSLNRIREVVVAQQHALSEQRIRAVNGSYMNDEYSSMDGDYRGSGGFAGGDAKKRRGVSSCLGARV
jgi:hypothetical protein